MGRSISLWGPVLAFMALLSVLSHQSRVPAAELVGDKLAHAAAYAVFTWLALRATHGGVRPAGLERCVLAVVLTLAYGLVDEVHQAFVPGRFPSALDWLADAVGAVLAIPLFAAAGDLRMRWLRTRFDGRLG